MTDITFECKQCQSMRIAKEMHVMLSNTIQLICEYGHTTELDG